MRDPRGYRVAASLPPEDVEAADRIAAALRDEGWPHATRSVVIREAIGELAETLRGYSTEEVFRRFVSRRGRRVLALPEPKKRQRRFLSADSTAAKTGPS